MVAVLVFVAAGLLGAWIVKPFLRGWVPNIVASCLQLALGLVIVNIVLERINARRRQPLLEAARERVRRALEVLAGAAAIDWAETHVDDQSDIPATIGEAIERWVEGLGSIDKRDEGRGSGMAHEIETCAITLTNVAERDRDLLDPAVVDSIDTFQGFATAAVLAARLRASSAVHRGEAAQRSRYHLRTAMDAALALVAHVERVEGRSLDLPKPWRDSAYIARLGPMNEPGVVIRGEGERET